MAMAKLMTVVKWFILVSTLDTQYSQGITPGHKKTFKLSLLIVQTPNVPYIILLSADKLDGDPYLIFQQENGRTLTCFVKITFFINFLKYYNFLRDTEYGFHYL